MLAHCNVARSANIYVVDGASGSGTSWSDAYGEISSAESAASRGDTIYVADGDYSGVTFNVAVSGTTLIYVKKATASDHGTETGWSSAYGDGVANIGSGNTVGSDYWEIDGQYGSLDGDFGFRFFQTGDGKAITISIGVDHVDIIDCELEGPGYSYDAYNGANMDGIYISGSSEGDPPHDITLTRCWIHNWNRTAVWTWRTYNLIFDSCWFTEVYASDEWGVNSVHGEAFSINNSLDGGTGNIVKNCVFRNIEGSGWLVWNNNFTAEHYDWEVYGNHFYVDSNHILDGWESGRGTEPTASDFTGTDGIITALNVCSIDNVKIYHNTFSNLYQSNPVAITKGGVTATNTEARNNLFIHASYTGSWNANTTSNNDTQGTSIATSYPTNPRPTAATDTEGYTLGSPYNVDPDSNSRGDDGYIDVGAYEYAAGGGSSASTMSGLGVSGGLAH